MTATSGNNGNIFLWLLFVIIVFVCLMGMVGCKAPCPTVATDTETTIKIHIRDTAIITQSDSASVKLLLRCDSTNSVLMDQIDVANGERLQMALQLQKLANGNSVLQVDCNEDSLLQIIQLKDSIINSKTIKTVVRIEKQKDFVYWCGWVLIGLFIAISAMRIIILILKFAK